LPQWVKKHGLRAVYFVHDLIPLIHPQYCRRGEVDKHARRIENVLISASGVIGNSQATIDELGAFAAQHRLRMPSAVAAPIAGPSVPDTLAPAVLERPYFITVGTIEGRKNHILLLRIWERLARRYGPKSPLLLIVGQRGWEAEPVFDRLDRDAKLRGHVLEMNECSDAELAAHMSAARALLFPSFTEGYGLPMIEALGLGVPVIASDLPVFREIGGAIPEFIDPVDKDSWEAAILDFAKTGSDAREEQLRRITSFRLPTWSDHFEAVERWLASLGVTS